jgi:Tfp pilus assembly protein PilF
MGMVIEPHWLVFSYIGFFLLIVAVWNQVSAQWPRKLKLIIVLLFYTALYAANQPFLMKALSEDSYCQYWREVCPRNTIPAIRLGVIQTNRGEYEDAKRYFNEVMVMKNVWGSKEVCFNLASINFAQGKLDAAHEYLNKTLELDPEYPFAYHLLAMIEVEKNGHTDLAESYFQRSLAAKDFPYTFMINVGDFYILREKYREAYDFYESHYKAFSKRTEKRIVASRLILAALLLHDKENAIRWFEEFALLNPDPGDVSGLLDLLKAHGFSPFDLRPSE